MVKTLQKDLDQTVKEDYRNLEDSIGFEENDFEDGVDISIDLPDNSLIHRKVHLEIAKILCGYVTERKDNEH